MNTEQQLIGIIKARHATAAEADPTSRESLEADIAAGEALIEARNRLPHGQFFPWVEKHCGMRRPVVESYIYQAQQMRRVAREFEQMRRVAREFGRATT